MDAIAWAAHSAPMSPGRFTNQPDSSLTASGEKESSPPDYTDGSHTHQLHQEAAHETYKCTRNDPDDRYNTMVGYGRRSDCWIGRARDHQLHRAGISERPQYAGCDAASCSAGDTTVEHVSGSLGTQRLNGVPASGVNVTYDPRPTCSADTARHRRSRDLVVERNRLTVFWPRRTCWINASISMSSPLPCGLLSSVNFGWGGWGKAQCGAHIGPIDIGPKRLWAYCALRLSTDPQAHPIAQSLLYGTGLSQIANRRVTSTRKVISIGGLQAVEVRK